ncbi:ThiF family adenylyltransferase [Aerosakkonemataceae cyanobacterium BLCC-F50]|uniref:ThiF family adenylyltransferase n=1 Tax=Floridaenema flaviceps BLCC-F50 TaxID=3153642 RepID=A0ABV4XIV9_9CYAN
MSDSSYPNALPILLTSHKQIQFFLVGCGGTGGFLAPMLARLIVALEKGGMPAQGTFVDFDVVDNLNVPRQNFCDADIGFNKAEVLATRYSLAYGIKLGAYTNYFSGEMVNSQWQKLIILIGCVDNSAARIELSKVLDLTDYYYANRELPRVWWIDCGNFGQGVPAGQVLLGSTNDFQPKKAFNDLDNPNFCVNLPSPSFQHPDLLVPQPEELTNQQLSCAQIAAVNAQSLFINQRVATEAIEMLSQLVLTKSLRRFATYFHCGSGSSRSRYTSQETLMSLCN